MSNAMKFTSKGYISIEVDMDKVNKKLLFSVIDTGIGIKKSD
jgi:signal transduction histidine kinase